VTHPRPSLVASGVADAETWGMRKPIGAIAATGVVVTTVVFVWQREAVSRCPERKAVRVTTSRFRA